MKFRHLLCSGIILIIHINVMAQKSLIDKIESKDDVMTFLQSEINSKITDKDIFHTSDKKDSPKKLKNQFLIMDLDQDGVNDLLLYGKFLGAVMSRDGRPYEFHNLDLGSFDYMSYNLLKIDSIASYENQPSLIVRHHPNYNQYVEFNDTNCVSLIYKFGYFIPFNPAPSKHSFSKITFKTTACYGRCPVFKLSISANGIAEYEPTKYNELEGKFTCQLTETTISHLALFLNYLELDNLAEKYANISTDQPTYFLSILRDDNTEKRVQDYGQMGPFQLQAVYRYLFKLRKTADWVKV